MKNSKKIFSITAIVIIIFSLAYVYFLLEAKNIIAKKIEQATGHKTTINKLNIKPPLNLEIRGLNIAGLVKVDYIDLAPSIYSFLLGRIVLNKVKIVSPEFTYRRTAPIAPIKDSPAVVTAAAAPVTEAPVVEAPAAMAIAQHKSSPIIIKILKVYSGRLNFTDTTASSGVINFIIKNIDFSISNLSTSEIKSTSNFSLKGNISWNTGEPDGNLLLEGWVNFHKKDMLADLKIENIDAIVFYPYYSTWVDLGKARIEKAKLNFSSNIKGVNNNVSAVCHLELADVVRKVRPSEEPQEKAERLTDAVLDMFKSMNNGKVVLDFTLNTKMDQPAFGFGDIKSAFEGKLNQGRAQAGLRPQDMLLLPAKILQGGIKSGTDISTAIVDGIFTLGSEIKKFFEEALNKPAPEN